MKKRLLALLLTIIIPLQILIPQNIFAKEDKGLSQRSLVNIGMINSKSYGAKVMNELNKVVAKNSKPTSNDSGVSLFSAGPYFKKNNEPEDEDKPKYYVKVNANLDLQGLDGNKFQWNEIFGVDESGNPKPAQIIFRQMDADTSVDTGFYYMLEITEGGEYTWSDGDGNPTELPLYSDSLKPYRYEVKVDERVSDKVKLLTEVISGTQGSSPTFSPENSEGKIIGNLTLGLTLQQIASTKFKSEWHTDVPEKDRPDIKANFKFDDEGDGLSPVSVELPKNDKDTKIIRDWYNDFDSDLVISSYLEKTPDVKLADNNTTYTKETIEDKRNRDYYDVITYKGHYYKYDFKYDVINGGKLTMTEVIPITFDPNGGEFDDFHIRYDKRKPYVLWVKYGGSILDKVPKNVKKDKKQFLGWSWIKKADVPDPLKDFNNITSPSTYYPVLSDDVAEYDPDKPQGEGSYDNFVRVHVDLTDKAKLETGDKQERHFKVDPTHKVILPVEAPKGKKDKDDKGREFTWKFVRWKEVKGADVTRKWVVNDTTKLIRDSFTEETWIEAVYEKDYTQNDEVKAAGKTYAESSKDVNGNFINNFLPSLDDIKLQVTIKDKPIPDDVVFNYIPGEDSNGNTYENFDAEIYDKLREKENDKENGVEKPVRIESIKAKLTYPDGEVKTVEIPLRVIKNIYEAKTLTKRPHYVPSNYKLVTVNPTKAAEDPQKTFFYVNPEAKVVIPGEDPVGEGDNQFIKWTYIDNGAETEYKLAEHPRHMFKKDTVITAQYESDVIPANDDGSRPDHVPGNYVEVKFIPTNKATDTKEKIYWVNPDKEVTIPVDDPQGKLHYTFDKWVDSANQEYKPTEKRKFEEAATFTATYNEDEDIIPYDPEDPKTKPEGYHRVKFAADEGLTLSNIKYYYVKEGKSLNLEDHTDTPDADKYYYPKVEAKTGYKFDNWNKGPQIENITDNITITAKATPLGDVIGKEEGKEKPKGYKEVKFVAGPNGKLVEGGNKIEEKIYYVNPNKFVTITPPATKADVGYKFGSWSQDSTIPTQYKEDVTTIKANFNGDDDVIPKTKDDESDKPNGYVTVTFETGEGGSIVDGQVKAYYVKPNTNVTLKAPKTQAEVGYVFDKWDPNPSESRTYSTNTTITGSFKKLEDIIPAKDGDTVHEKPKGYVEVKFLPGENGKLMEGDKEIAEKVYYVNPKANKTLGDESIIKPEVKPNTGYKFTGWDKDDSTQIKGDITVTATYNGLGDVIVPEYDEDGNPTNKPDGYISVKFDTTEKGKIKGTEDTKEKELFVNPDKAVVLKGKEPEVEASKGNTFSGWDVSIEKSIKYKNGDKITALYNQSPIQTNDKGRLEITDGEIITSPIETEVGKQLDPEVLAGRLKSKDPTNPIKTATVTQPADVDKPGFTAAILSVTLSDGTTVESKVIVYAKEPCKNNCPDPGTTPGDGGYTPSPNPNPDPKPTDPTDDDSDKGGEDKEEDQEDKEKTPDEKKENDKDKEEDPKKDPDKDEGKTPEKPGEKDPKEPGQNQPPVKTDKNKDQTGTKIVKTIGQTGNKVINQVKNFLNPSTGIISNYELYLGLMAASSVGLFFTRDKKNEDEE